MNKKPNNFLRDQFIALSLTIITCLAMIALLRIEIGLINMFISDKISTSIRISDIIIGLTIYLKTSVDFAIFIGRLMDKNQGLKGRIGIEIGTALGNAAGTMAILLIWSIFKSVNWLLALMIIIASLVLVRLAEDGLEHININKKGYPNWFKLIVTKFEFILVNFNKLTKPLLNKIIPERSLEVNKKLTFWALMTMAFTVPFILGLDDFAGYVPLFDVVNVYGFAIGVFVGHMILNVLLYLSPKRTIELVKNPVISFIGSVVFIGLAVWGFIEAYELLFHH